MVELKLRYFSPDEFQGWYDKISPKLLKNLDELREQWGRPIRISPASGAVGRRFGTTGTSQHNYDKWGEVRAVDVMPEGMDDVVSSQVFIDMAKEIGFTGIGFYPHWKPSPGVHLDVREAAPAVWGGLSVKGRQVYVSIDMALSRA